LNLLALGVALVSLRENDLRPCARDFFVIICEIANVFVASRYNELRDDTRRRV
jgi:hypothetical protein